jgi:hypothetical protein
VHFTRRWRRVLSGSIPLSGRVAGGACRCAAIALARAAVSLTCGTVALSGHVSTRRARAIAGSGYPRTGLSSGIGALCPCASRAAGSGGRSATRCIASVGGVACVPPRVVVVLIFIARGEADCEKTCRKGAEPRVSSLCKLHSLLLGGEDAPGRPLSGDPQRCARFTGTVSGQSPGWASPGSTYLEYHRKPGGKAS